MFAGTFHYGDAIGSHALDEAASPFPRASAYTPDREGCWQSGPAGLFEQRRYIYTASRDAQVPTRCPETVVTLAFWGRLDNRAALAEALDRPADGQDPLTDAQLVLAGWRRWQERLPDHLLGDFALAVVDPHRQGVFLARDPLGVKPLYYRLSQRGLSFATSVAALRALEGEPLRPAPGRQPPAPAAGGRSRPRRHRSLRRGWR